MSGEKPTGPSLQGTISADGARKKISTALAEKEVSWELLFELAVWTKSDSAKLREVAHDHLHEAITCFKQDRACDKVGLSPPVGGVYLLDDGEFRVTFQSSNIRFDWSEARPLIHEIEVLAEEAEQWWRPGKDQQGRASAFLRKVTGATDPATRRRPHSRRAFGLATWVLGALQQENERHAIRDGNPPPDPNPIFMKLIGAYRADLAATQIRFRAAAQREAQSRYWRGVMAGAFLLAGFCALLGAVFWWRGTNAAYGVAIPAGGLGAMVSVLQRMTSGKLVLDIDASRDLLRVFGAVRPFIGAIFGLAFTALLLGGIIPAIEVPEGKELAFFAGLGFLAGFNERWAQDMLKASATRLGSSRSMEEGFGASRDPAAGPGDALAVKVITE